MVRRSHLAPGFEQAAVGVAGGVRPAGTNPQEPTGTKTSTGPFSVISGGNGDAQQPLRDKML